MTANYYHQTMSQIIIRVMRWTK